MSANHPDYYHQRRFLVLFLVAYHGGLFRSAAGWTPTQHSSFCHMTSPHSRLCSNHPPHRPRRSSGLGLLTPPTTTTQQQQHLLVLQESHQNDFENDDDESKDTPAPTTQEEEAVSSSSTTSSQSLPLDKQALVKYLVAIGVQMTLFTAIFKVMDLLLAQSGLGTTPFWVNCIVFWFLALKSRVLNPMNNARPKRDNLETNEIKRKMPSWTPPGILFPIMWILIIAPLRAISTAWVYQTMGTYANVAISSFVLHLCIGDVWNSINNTERRYGTSVVGVTLVWLSKAHAAVRYYQVCPRAGHLLALPLVWLTIASALIVRTWQLNPDPVTGKRYTLYPAQGQGAYPTQFTWFRSNNKTKKKKGDGGDTPPKQRNGTTTKTMVVLLVGLIASHLLRPTMAAAWQPNKDGSPKKTMVFRRSSPRPCRNSVIISTTTCWAATLDSATASSRDGSDDWKKQMDLAYNPYRSKLLSNDDDWEHFQRRYETEVGSSSSSSDPFWEQIRQEAQHAVQQEAEAGPQLYQGILSQPSLLVAVVTVVAHQLETELISAVQLKNLFLSLLTPQDEKAIRMDLQAVSARSPSVDGALPALLFHNGFHALTAYRVAHELWKAKRKALAYYMQSVISRKYSADIHPASSLGHGIYLRVGAGVVIGETAVVGNDVSILEGVTLGGTGKESGDRHPKIGNGVIIYDGGTVLGNIRVGDGAVVQAKAIVTKPVPPLAVMQGVPARIVEYRNLTAWAFEDDLQAHLWSKYSGEWKEIMQRMEQESQA